MGKRNPAYYEAKNQEDTAKLRNRARDLQDQLDHINKVGNSGMEQLQYADMTHIQMANEMRMLGRDSVNHEGVCTGTRDRIYWLAANLYRRDQEVAFLKEELLKYNPAIAEELAQKLPPRFEFTPEQVEDAASMHRRRDPKDPLGTRSLDVFLKEMELERAQAKAAKKEQDEQELLYIPV